MECCGELKQTLHTREWLIISCSRCLNGVLECLERFHLKLLSGNAIFDPGWDVAYAECPILYAGKDAANAKRPILDAGCAAANSRRPILSQRVSKVK